MSIDETGKHRIQATVKRDYVVAEFVIDKDIVIVSKPGVSGGTTERTWQMRHDEFEAFVNKANEILRRLPSYVAPTEDDDAA